MSTVYFPVQVVVLLRRLANALSTLSISNQYLFIGNAVARSEEGQDSDRSSLSESEKQCQPSIRSWTILQALRDVTWPWPWWVYTDNWDWPKLRLRDRMAFSIKTLETRWFGSNWPVALDGQLHKGPRNMSDPPIPSAKSLQRTMSAAAMHEESDICIARIMKSTRTLPMLVHVYSSMFERDQPTPPPSESPRDTSKRPHQTPQSPPQPQPPPDLEKNSKDSVSSNLGTSSLSPDAIHQLLQNPTLYAPLLKPRYPIVLCHGLYGFDVRGPSSFPSLRVHYWSNVLDILRNTVGANVIVTAVPGTGSIVSRAQALDLQLKEKARGQEINFLAHSMGGLDCRYLISHLHPTDYNPLSLMTIGTPHRGSPFMDWCVDNLGIGKLRAKEELIKQSTSADVNKPTPAGDFYPTSTPSPNLPSTTTQTTPSHSAKGLLSSTHPFSMSLTGIPSSFTTLLLSLVDTPAYFNLTTSFLANHFNPVTPDDPRVKYFSVAGRISNVSVFHPFWFPKMVLDGVEEKERRRLREQHEHVPYDGDENERPLWAREEEWGNDGLVPVRSAKWGEFLGVMEGCDHWEMRGARGIAGDLHVDLSITDGWGLKDWGKLVSGFRKDEKRKKHEADFPQSDTGEKQDKFTEMRDSEKDKEDPDVNSSTKNLSAVFDWIVDQVPTPPKVSTSTATKDVLQKTEKDKRNQLASKDGLKRFYVALSRKLYDEGF